MSEERPQDNSASDAREPTRPGLGDPTPPAQSAPEALATPSDRASSGEGNADSSRAPSDPVATTTVDLPAGGAAGALSSKPNQIPQGYSLVAKLGGGGFGDVYRAKHEVLDRFVALKILRADLPHEAKQRFIREGRALAALDPHPNTVQVWDAGETDGAPFLAMELVEGVDLSRVAYNRGALRIADACELIRQAAEGLQHVLTGSHGKIRAHRDVKPSNLILNTKGQVKLLDLGLAKLDEGAAANDQTESGRALGTFKYIAPEQCVDAHEADIRADIYSLGCTLYHLLSGSPPFQGSRQELIDAHRHQPVPSIRSARPDVPEELEQVIGRMLAKKPHVRYSSPTEAALALAPFTEGHDLLRLLPQELRTALSAPPSSLSTLPASPSPPSSIERTYGKLRKICFWYGLVAISLTAAVLRAARGFPNEHFNRFPLMTPWQWGHYLATFIGLCAVVIGVDLLALSFQYRPLRRLLQGTPEVPKRTDAETALVRAVSLPMLTFYRVIGLHGPVALVFTTLWVVMGDALLGIEFNSFNIAVMWSMIFVMVPAHGMLEYFAVLKAVRPLIDALHQPLGGRSPSDLHQRVTRAPLQRKLLFASVFITLVPLLVLGSTSLREVSSLLDELAVSESSPHLSRLGVYLASIAVACGIITVAIALFLARELGESTRRLSRAMHAVSTGRLDAHLHVISTDEFADLYQGFNRMVAELHERQRLQKMLGSYVSSDLLDVLKKYDFDHYGERISGSVLFAAVRNYEQWSEHVTPKENLQLLDRLAQIIASSSHEQRPWLVKFHGDRFMVVFGVKEGKSDHATRAMQTALRLREGAKELHKWQSAGVPPGLEVEMGIHSGSLFVGNLGSTSCQELTALGEVVSGASQLAKLSEKHQAALLVSKQVLNALDQRMEVRSVTPEELPSMRVFAVD